MQAFEAVEPSQPVAVVIGQQILAAIQDGTFPVGSRLPGEIELSRQFGVSRPSIREALSALQFAGYIESRRGTGSVVMSLVSVDGAKKGVTPVKLTTAEDVIEWIEARFVIEPQAMAIAARDPDPSALASAQELVAGMRLAVAERAFHPTTDLRLLRALADVCRNRLLSGHLHGLLDLASEPALAPARDRAWESDALPKLWADQHQAIVEAIDRRAPADAEAIARERLASSADNIRAALDLPQPAHDRLDALLATPPSGTSARRPSAPGKPRSAASRTRGQPDGPR